MADMNTVSLIGRLTRDPELRQTTTGQKVCAFSLAVNRMKKKDEQEAQADFPNIVAWNHDAEYLTQYGQKGDQVAVTGRIQTRNYDDKDGRKVYVTEVVANSIQLIGGRKSQSAGSDIFRTGETITKDDISKQIQEEAEGFASDDLPF